MSENRIMSEIEIKVNNILISLLDKTQMAIDNDDFELIDDTLISMQSTIVVMNDFIEINKKLKELT